MGDQETDKLWDTVDTIRADMRVMASTLTRVEVLLGERWTQQIERCGNHQSIMRRQDDRLTELEAQMNSQFPSCPDLDRRLTAVERRIWWAMGGLAVLVFLSRFADKLVP